MPTIAPPPDLGALLGRAGPDATLDDARLIGADASCDLASFRSGCFVTDAGALAGRSILLATDDQLDAALALVTLDGLARRMVICPPGTDPAHLGALCTLAEVDAVVGELHPELTLPRHAIGRTSLPHRPASMRHTEWILLTSGTTGRPKLVLHDLASLTAPIKPGLVAAPDTVWATFYDIRRYGGLQIFLRAMSGGHSLVLGHAGEPLSAHLQRLATAGVTHISGTPSHWRRLMMSGEADRIAPRYVRLSGEIADQAVLDALAETFPKAAISHAYASTEAGVGFNVTDGREGFPATLIDAPDPASGVELRIADGTLWLRSNRTSPRYLGAEDGTIRNVDGFVDSGDFVERRGDRYVFTGRRGGIINVGGQKVHPEEVEIALGRHPAVRIARVHARRNPITGALVAADIVARDAADRGPALRDDILAHCRKLLAPHKVPATIRFLDAIEISAAGKLVRHG